MAKQDDTDPLPYVQVDRAVKPKAALLAGALGVTTQHALGSLVEWWDLNGDPRALMAIVEATPEGVEPVVVVDAAAARERFSLASGRPCEPSTLVHLGLLEPLDGGVFRVRGMSRYFAPIKARARAATAASAGGKSRMAKAQRGPDGRLIGAAGGSAGGSAGGRPAGNQPTASRRTSREPADSQPTASPNDQRSTINDQGKDLRPSRVRPPPDPRHAPLVKDLTEAFQQARGNKYPFDGGRDARVVTNLLARAEPGPLLEAWKRALRYQGFPTVSTLAEFDRHLPRFLGESKPMDGRDPDFDHAASWGVP